MSVCHGGTLSDLAKLSRPRMLQIREEPAGWLADVYNTLTTNSSNNPLNEVLVKWLRRRFCSRGMARLASCTRSVRSLKGSADSRGPTAVGHGGDGGRYPGRRRDQGDHRQQLGKQVQGKLYDRVSELRRVGSQARIPVKSILLFDGDLEQAQLDELATGIGHDEICKRRRGPCRD